MERSDAAGGYFWSTGAQSLCGNFPRGAATTQPFIIAPPGCKPSRSGLAAGADRKPQTSGLTTRGCRKPARSGLTAPALPHHVCLPNRNILGRARAPA